MEIKINPGIDINDIHFGVEKGETEKIPNPGNLLFIEYKNNKVAAISFRNQPEFIIQDKTIRLNNIEEWLKSENPYFDGDNYIFPDLNIAAFGLNNVSGGYEVTAYSHSLKNIYEKDIDQKPKYLDLNNKKATESKLSIIPNESIGQIKFGCTKEDAIGLLGKADNTGKKGTATELLYWSNVVLRFENNSLVQATYYDVKPIFLEGEDISSTGPQAKIFADSTVFINRAYKIFFDFNIAFTGFDNPREQKTIIVFSEQMKSFWSNTKRPLL